MKQADSAGSHYVLVAPGSGLTAAAGGEARFQVSLAGVTDLNGLCDRFVADLGLPYPCGGLDGLADWLSDLDWLEHGAGVTLVLDATGAASGPLLSLCEVLPSVVDRWRGSGEPFVVTVVGDFAVDQVVQALRRGNDVLTRHAALPWALPGTAPVPVVVGD